MLSEIFARMFRKKSPAPQSQPDRVAVKTDGRAPSGDIPEGTMICFFREGMLLDVCREGRSPAPAAGETCWLVPSDDVPLQITLDAGGQTAAADLSVRFEPDSQLADLLEERSDLLREDLEALVTSQLVGLLDLLGQHASSDLLDMDDESRERLRAKLSLLLQTHGMRCTGLDRFYIVLTAVPAGAAGPKPGPGRLRGGSAADTPLLATLADPAPPAGAEEPAAAAAAAELEPVLAKAIRSVKTDRQWEDLMAEIEASGMPVDEPAAAELDEIGEDVVGGEVKPEQAARRIRTMAEEAARKSGIPSPDLRRWKGLALRLRASETAAAPAEEGFGEPLEFAGGGSPLRPARRPWTWWMLRRSSIDGRLQSFLKECTSQTRAALEQYRARLKDIRRAGQVRELGERLRTIDDLLATVPTLQPRWRKLRLDGGRVKELVQSVERAVTAAEMAQAEARELIQCPPGSDAWDEALAATDASLSALAEHLRARRAVR